MVRCITAHQLWQQYGVTSPLGDVYHPIAGWWLLVTSLDKTSPVNPGTLLICLGNLRTLENLRKIRLLDKNSFTFEYPVTVLAALSVVHDWSYKNMGMRPLRRTVWHDRKAILDHLAPGQSKHLHGKAVNNAPKVKPYYLPRITYDETDILQARGTVVVWCPVDLMSYSAIARSVLREYGQEDTFRLRHVVGKAIHLVKSPIAPWNNDILLLFTRASNKHPMLHDVLHLCSTDLANKLIQAHNTQINILPAWYSMLRDHFIESNIDIVLHDRVFVSIASVTAHSSNTKHKLY